VFIRCLKKLSKIIRYTINNFDKKWKKHKIRRIIMRMLAQFFPEFVELLDDMDKLYEEKREIDEKTYQFICFALSIKARSKPCVLKHFKGALKAGATVKELSYILALTMRESAGADDCWTHDVIGDFKEIIKGNICCDCEK
jgi:AhpD family alkylhydroperoxidase